MPERVRESAEEPRWLTQITPAPRTGYQARAVLLVEQGLQWHIRVHGCLRPPLNTCPRRTRFTMEWRLSLVDRPRRGWRAKLAKADLVCHLTPLERRLHASSASSTRWADNSGRQCHDLKQRRDREAMAAASRYRTVSPKSAARPERPALALLPLVKRRVSARSKLAPHWRRSAGGKDTQCGYRRRSFAPYVWSAQKSWNIADSAQKVGGGMEQALSMICILTMSRPETRPTHTPSYMFAWQVVSRVGGCPHA
jgi:hypothetical protein